MPDFNDQFALNTNLSWDGEGAIVDQLRGKTFGVNGLAAGDYVAESTTAVIHEVGTGSDDGRVNDASSTRPNDSITLNAGTTVTGVTGKLDWVIGITQYEVRLTDGTIFTQADIGGQLPIRILDSSAGRRIFIDFGDTTLAMLNNERPIASIFIPQSAGQDSDYASYVRSSFDAPYSPICFGFGTLIKTQDGVRPVETLRVGDMILTLDNGLQPIRWIGSRHLSSDELSRFPKFQPIRIKAGKLGVNTPETDLIVSPQHRILVRSKVAQCMFNANEVLVAAKHLLECDGVEVAEDMAEVEYFHILFDQHDVIFSNGAESESLYTGAEAIKSLSPAAREEIFALFPQLQEQDPAIIRPAVRPLISGRMGRQLAMRHSRNKHQLVS